MTFFRVWPTLARSASSVTTAASAASYLAESSSRMASAAGASPDCAIFAASISRLVTPLMAETTATQFPARARAAMIWAARRIHAASPTEVPPNFMTCKADFIRLPFTGDRACLAGRPCLSILGLAAKSRAIGDIEFSDLLHRFLASKMTATPPKALIFPWLACPTPGIPADTVPGHAVLQGVPVDGVQGFGGRQTGKNYRPCRVQQNFLAYWDAAR